MYRHRIRPPGGNRLALSGRSGISGSIGNLFIKALGSLTLAMRGRTSLAQPSITYITTAPVIPIWTSAPQITVQQGSIATVPVLVEAIGYSITLAWVSGTIGGSSTPIQPAWIQFNNGLSPSITLTGAQLDSQDVTNLVISATANGTTVNCPVGGFITVNPVQSASGDWGTRIGDQNVVWYHSFDADAEVNQFRRVGGYGDGNNPSGSQWASNMYRVPSGGADGGGYMEFLRPAGSNEIGANWLRMFSPLTGASNGRGADDPGANGTLPRQTYTPTEQGRELLLWGYAPRPGWYGKAQYAGSFAGNNPLYPQPDRPFDGQEFYLQVRVKMDPRRMTDAPLSPQGGINGKTITFTNTTDVTYSNQEYVVVGAYPEPSSPVGGPYQNNIHAMYDGSYGYVGDGPVTQTATIDNRTSPQWSYSGGWDTLLYHFVPGTNSPQNPPFVYDQIVEVWAAHQGETTYTKIWDVVNKVSYADNDSAYYEYQSHKFGYNQLWVGCFQGGGSNANLPTETRYGYDQFIFSKAFIPCPQDYKYTGTLTVDTYSLDGVDVLQNTGDLVMKWMSSFPTIDGTVILWADDNHGTGTRDIAAGRTDRNNCVREYDPIAKALVSPDPYPDNGNYYDAERHNNRFYWYVNSFVWNGDTYDGLIIPVHGVFARKKNGQPWNKWINGTKPSALGVQAPRPMSTHADPAHVAHDPLSVIYDDTGIYAPDCVYGGSSLYNPHHAWSQELNCGVAIGGGAGNDSPYQEIALFVVPSAGLGTSRTQPFTMYVKGMPWSTAGVYPSAKTAKTVGRDGCCFVGKYVYWIGGSTGYYVDTPVDGIMFRMDMTPHLTSKSVTPVIQRLTALPAGGILQGCLRYDPTVNCLVLWCEQGVWAYDLSTPGVDGVGTWVDLTAQMAAKGYAVEAVYGTGRGHPRSVEASFIGSRNGQSLQKFVWRPGNGANWAGTATPNYNRFFSMKLKRV